MSTEFAVAIWGGALAVYFLLRISIGIMSTVITSWFDWLAGSKKYDIHRR